MFYTFTNLQVGITASSFFVHALEKIYLQIMYNVYGNVNVKK